MDTKKVEGAAKWVLGKLQDTVGTLAGDSSQCAGKRRNWLEKFRRYTVRTLSKVRQTTKQNPFVAVVTDGLAGFLLGALWASPDGGPAADSDGYSRSGRLY